MTRSPTEPGRPGTGGATSQGTVRGRQPREPSSGGELDSDLPRASEEGDFPVPHTFQLRDLSAEAWVAIPLLAVLVGLLTAQVVLRFFFHTAVSWLEEVIRILFVWSMYFSFVVAASDNRHIRVALHISALPQFAQRVVFTIADLIWIGFNLVVTYFGIEYVASLFDFPYLSPTTGINLAWVYMIVPIGFALLTVRVAVNIFRMWRGDVFITDSRIDG